LWLLLELFIECLTEGGPPRQSGESIFIDQMMHLKTAFEVSEET